MSEASQARRVVAQAQASTSRSAWRALPANATRFVRSFWQQHPSLTVGLALVLIVNLILIAAYLWSRGGQTTHVRIEARGDEFVAYIDGRRMIEGEFDAPGQGGIIVVLDDLEDIPSLPTPRGVDSVRVTDLRTDEVLFADDFSSGRSERWQADLPPTFSNEGGVLGGLGRGTLSLLNVPWRDYALDVTYKNVQRASVMVRAQDPATGVSYNFRPFRHFDNGLLHVNAGETVAQAPGPLIELSKAQTIESMVAMTLGPYPLALVALAVGLVSVAALQFAGMRYERLGLLRPSPTLAWVVVAVAAAGAFGVTLFFNYAYGDHMPHVPDEVSYIFQAKLLASGHLAASPPPVEEAFDFFFPPFILVSGDNWASVYPFGHPLVLAIGVKLGAIWLIPPLLGAASVVMIFVVGRKVHNVRIGLAAALLLASSPFFLMTASNFMSHNTGVFYILLSLLFLAFLDRRPILYGILAGLFFGLLFNTRPLTGMALVPPFGLLLLTQLAPRDRRLTGAKQIAAFTAGGLVMLGAYWLYNWGTTGDAFSNGYQASGGLGEVVGFGGAHSVSVGIQNEQTQLTYLLLVLHSWPRYVGLLFVLLPFMLGTRHRWDWFLLTSAVFVMGAYSLFASNGVMHGPRYWYEAVPFLMLLTARGTDMTAERLASGAAALRQRFSLGAEGASLWSGAVVVYAVVLALVGSSLYGWLLGRHSGWNADFVPDRATDLQSFNDIDDRLISLVDEADLDNALVLVEGTCPHWQCFGNVFWMNSPGLDGDVVFARDLPNRYADLFSAYPDRRVYVATFSSASLVPFGSNGDAPKADEVANELPTPPPPPTPSMEDLVGAAERDEQRIQDLATIADALQVFYRRHGAYPLAEGLQSFCQYRELDSGCRLEEVLDPLPADPSPQGLYRYLSDGQTFTLFVQLEGEAPPSDCPDPLPDVLVNAPGLYCVQGSPPNTS